MLGVKAAFATPYLLIKRVLTPGDEWDASMTVRGREVRATVSVGQRGEVVTAAGTFQAVPVTLQSDALHYVRWYTKDVRARSRGRSGGRPASQHENPAAAPRVSEGAVARVVALGASNLTRDYRYSAQ